MVSSWACLVACLATLTTGASVTSAVIGVILHIRFPDVAAADIRYCRHCGMVLLGADIGEVELFVLRSGADVRHERRAERVAPGDGGQSLSIGTQRGGEDRHLGLAQLWEPLRDVRDRAVVLAELLAVADL